MLNNADILITGGTGSWGHELAKQLFGYTSSITIMARNESNLVKMSREHPQYNYMIGDVRDYATVEDAISRHSKVFHLAAIKHVPICETQPHEAIETNIRGSENIVKACNKWKREAVLVSTDKAVEPVNTYGISKAMAEKLFLHSGHKVIRAGNVIGSSGSVIPLFSEQIKNNESITLTHEDMTRFFMTLPQAIHLVLNAYYQCSPGDIGIIKMPSFKLTDIAYTLAGTTDYPIDIIGIRPGEKLHEVLISEAEIPDTYWDPTYNMYIVTKYPKKAWVNVIDKYSSKNVTHDMEELKKLLADAGYLNF